MLYLQGWWRSHIYRDDFSTTRCGVLGSWDRDPHGQPSWYCPACAKSWVEARGPAHAAFRADILRRLQERRTRMLASI